MSSSRLFDDLAVDHNGALMDGESIAQGEASPNAKSFPFSFRRRTYMRSRIRRPICARRVLRADAKGDDDLDFRGEGSTTIGVEVEQIAMQRLRRLVRALAWLYYIASATFALAQSHWPPFAQQEAQRSQPGTPKAVSDANPGPTYLAPMDGVIPFARDASEPGETHQKHLPTTDLTPALAERNHMVDRTELAPIPDHEGSGLASDFWRGLDAANLEALMAPLALPPRSVALNGLWHRALLTRSSSPAAQDATAVPVLRTVGPLKTCWVSPIKTARQKNSDRRRFTARAR